MVAHGRWGQSDAPVGLQAHRSGDVQNCPVARPRTAFRCVMGPLLRKSERRKSKALLSAPLGISATCPASQAAEPRGAREAWCQRRLPRGSRRQKISLLRIQWGPVPEELASSSERVQAVRLRSGSRDCGAVKLLSTQIVRKQAKAIFHLQRRGTLRATSSSTLSNSTNAWSGWQRRS